MTTRSSLFASGWASSHWRIFSILATWRPPPISLSAQEKKSQFGGVEVGRLRKHTIFEGLVVRNERGHGVAQDRGCEKRLAQVDLAAGRGQQEMDLCELLGGHGLDV